MITVQFNSRYSFRVPQELGGKPKEVRPGTLDDLAFLAPFKAQIKEVTKVKVVPHRLHNRKAFVVDLLPADGQGVLNAPETGRRLEGNWQRHPERWLWIGLDTHGFYDTLPEAEAQVEAEGGFILPPDYQ